ncbi:MAG: SUF system NifU family Fe-S cluster assembly protein [Erysipelotrichaceae bacterium]|nr:SUF system NifU family Fe-S cluster assembly protein [Erysipelotrichaceae bacterium]
MSNYFDDPMILRQIIMDHYEYPRNHELKKQEGYTEVHMASESCIDDIYVEAKIVDGIIEDTGFEGTACTIATASTSIMSDLIKGKSTSEAMQIINNYLSMIDEKEYDEDMLDELIAFKTVSKQANRIKCATIGIKGFVQLIEESEKNHE